jgi:hypothetical protein
MKGKIFESNDGWVIQYTDYRTTGGNPKVLGSYDRRLSICSVPLHPGDVKVLDRHPGYVNTGSQVKFKKVKLNPMGREVDPLNLTQNQSGCVWYGKLIFDEEIKVVKDDEFCHYSGLPSPNSYVNKENDWEEILFDFIDFYPCMLPHELFEWLEENYEIPKKKDGK